MALDLSKLENFKEYGSKAEARCPACAELGQDKKGNHLFIKVDGTYGCVANAGDAEHRKRIFEIAGIKDKTQKPSAPLPSYRAAIGKPMAPPSEPATPAPAVPDEPKVEAREVCAYRYQDATGADVYEVVRYEPKDFRPYKVTKDGKRAWQPGLGNLTRIPYRLPELMKATEVWIVEGEKDADNLAALGIAATTRAGGSSLWEDDLSHWFKDKDVVFCGDNDKGNKLKPGPKYRASVEAALKPIARSFRHVHIPDPHNDISDALEGLSDTEAHSLIATMLVDPMTKRLEPRRFDVNRPPVRTEPVLWINDAGIAKPGDLVVIQAQVKSGKSSLLAAAMGCLMGAGRLDCDFLGIRGFNPKGLPVLHIDTEQTPEDHYDMIMRTLKRAGLDSPPSWFHSYCLTEFSVDERRQALRFETDRMIKLHGGLCAIFLDGSADMVHDVNDATEANEFVDELFTMAIRCACPLMSIIHENHSSEDGKTRGHLGSQLMRKAASNLRLAKDGSSGVIQLWGEKLRRGHIAKGSGPHFIWDDERGMHISCETSKEATLKVRDQAKAQMLAECAAEIFSGTVTTLRHADLMAALMKREACSDKTAKRHIIDMKSMSIIKHELYLYRLNHNFKLG